MISRIIIPDASFFICFIDDIAQPNSLLKIVWNPNFKFVTANIILSEIKKHPIDDILEKKLLENLEIFRYHDYGEILKPFLAKIEIKKGEHEVIVISYILNYKGHDFISILDDDAPKKYLTRLIPEKQDSIMGTVGFIEICTSTYSIFEGNEAISILILIKASKFRIEERIIDEAIQRVNGAKR